MSKRHSWLKIPASRRTAHKRYLHAFCYAFNLHTLCLMAMACFSVYVCDKYRFAYNMDFSLVSVGTAFPL
jgi:hypothetical protein